MSASAELDPELQQRQQTMETRWGELGISYEDAMLYYASEYGWLTGEQVPADPGLVLSHPDMISMALHPGQDDAEAIRRWKSYTEKVPAVGRELLRPHVEAPGSRITPLDDDPEKYDAQRPLSFYVDGNPVDREYTDITAKMVEPRYPEVIERLGTDKNVIAAVRSAITMLEEGKSLWVVTPHAGDLIDIAFAMKTVRDLMDNQAYEPKDSIFNLAKAVAGWGQYDIEGAGPVEMNGVVKSIAHRIYTPWQNTETSKEVVAELPKTERDWNNSQITADTNEKLKKGGTVGALAPSGTTRIATDDPNVYNISSVNAGTLNLMIHPNVRILPMPMWRPGKEYIADVLKPIQARTPEEAHAVMRLMAASLTMMVEDKTFHYGDLPA